MSWVDERSTTTEKGFALQVERENTEATEKTKNKTETKHNQPNRPNQTNQNNKPRKQTFDLTKQPTNQPTNQKTQTQSIPTVLYQPPQLEQVAAQLAPCRKLNQRHQTSNLEMDLNAQWLQSYALPQT